MMTPRADVNTTLPLILSIVSLVMCGNYLFGVIALIFAIQAGSAANVGDVETAQSKVKMSYVMLGIGVGLTVLAGIGMFVFVGMLGAMQ